MTIDVLVAVIALVERRTYALAGEELSLSASAVHKRVRTAEGLLGQRLFIGTNEGMSLTKEGKVFYADAVRTVEQALLAEERMYASDVDWVFASELLFGKIPIWSNASLQKVLRPAARRARIMKLIGWHTFRHTYSTMLTEHGNDVKVVQELMRHAKLSTTMEIYTHPRMEKKREAQSKVVDMLFGRQRPEAVAL
ncbi:tyrosine-type recombinase/integrase [Edaphobacter sp.]|uniref:tyrosine-type recombinase/integrase n=1 Tax=Edaphobacter sp. TaxID=1934404 RepID=UPI002DB83650|nr:tyrosine-type recombinase/integrase [Edaphobacter sp.]HEU5340210.1 tyrosine-type recombinase/integrase [Edaphobacter sp.]